MGESKLSSLSKFAAPAALLTYCARLRQRKVNRLYIVPLWGEHPMVSISTSRYGWASDTTK
jgi:hypothetical protein